ncbi:MAG TPA: M17 family peptidase N-terminal domain-containing protein, partial [Burkholderiales bacterium]|nr:M17 family peptidase N-terminal domain-containing protein [Burkholderiales bacterium]
MEFSIKALSPETAKTGCVVLGVHAQKQLTPAARRVDERSRGALRAALDDLPGRAGATLLLRALPGVSAERVLVVSLGERKDYAEPAYRDAVRAAGSALRELGAKD